MKISPDYPPNYREITDALGDVSVEQPIFCYGDTIYNPFARRITEDLIAHERAHSERQKGQPDIWWMQYLYDEQFRLQEEIIGYAAQYKYAKKAIEEAKAKSSVLDWVLEGMARSLSGPVYGNIISHNEARSKIRNYGR